MIRKLKRRFITLAMCAVCILLTLVVVGMNVINYRTVVAEADDTLEVLGRYSGRFPDGNDRFFPLPKPMSPETPYESRYFSVLLDRDGMPILTDTGKIAAVDEGLAQEYAVRAYDRSGEKGFVGQYRYVKTLEREGTRIVFLDCGRKLESYYSFLYTSCTMAVIGSLAVFFAMLFFAGRVVRPVAQSYEKQKRFITDAGHELKTPLTIISANTDILEMELPEGSESLEDIRQQTRRLTKLTNDLVLLARMEETGDKLQKLPFPMSEITQEAAQPFRVLAQTQNKQFLTEIAPMVTLCGNAGAIGQLVTVLMDNALKYTPEGGQVILSLTNTGKTVVLTVQNTTEAVFTREDLEHLFDRFYRADGSRNSKTGGHGIGLSVAQAIVTAHGGKLQAVAPTGQFILRATFPI